MHRHRAARFVRPGRQSPTRKPSTAGIGEVLIKPLGHDVQRPDSIPTWTSLSAFPTTQSSSKITPSLTPSTMCNTSVKATVAEIESRVTKKTESQKLYSHAIKQKPTQLPPTPATPTVQSGPWRHRPTTLMREDDPKPVQSKSQSAMLNGHMTGQWNRLIPGMSMMRNILPTHRFLRTSRERLLSCKFKPALTTGPLMKVKLSYLDEYKQIPHRLQQRLVAEGVRFAKELRACHR